MTAGMRDLIRIVESAEPPRPLAAHIRDAIEHANCYGENDWTSDDFTITYLGLMHPEQLHGFDDLSSWVEAHDTDDLENFRDGAFATGSQTQYPPIIIITAPDGEGGCMTQIGDGRGRVNWAVAHNKPLHVYHMVYKTCDG